MNRLISVIFTATLIALPPCPAQSATRLTLNNTPDVKLMTATPTKRGTSDTGLKMLGEHRNDKTGLTHTRFQQLYQNTPVYGMTVIRHRRENTVKRSAPRYTGQLAEGLAEDLKGQTPDTAFTPAKARARATQAFWQKHPHQTQVLPSTSKVTPVIYLHQKHAFYAYQVDLLFDSPHQAPHARVRYFIDRQTHRVLHQESRLKHGNASIEFGGPGGNKKTGRYDYGVDRPLLQGTQKGFLSRSCYLDYFTDTGDYEIKTVDEDALLATLFQSSDSFNCGDAPYTNLPTKTNGAFGVENDAHYYVGVVHNFYEDWLGIDPVPNGLAVHVHYGDHYANAEWDGEKISLGDGDETSYPLVALDIMAHEITHGFTESTHPQLAYADHAGALDEAFADMAAVAAEFYSTGENNWGIGESVIKPGFGVTCADGTKDALRCLDDPTQDTPTNATLDEFAAKAHSIDTVKDYNTLVMACMVTYEDYYQSCLVHFASGIFNKAFYLLSELPGWDPQKAFTLFYTANRDYWSVGHLTFDIAAQDVIQAAKDLNAAIGKSTYEIAKVIEAFGEVGITCNQNDCTLPKETITDSLAWLLEQLDQT